MTLYPEPHAETKLGPWLEHGLLRIRMWAPGADSLRVSIFSTGEGSDVLAAAEARYEENWGTWFCELELGNRTGTSDVPDRSAGFAASVDSPLFYECAITRNGVSKTVPDPFARSAAVWRGTGPMRMAVVDTKRLEPGSAELNDNQVSDPPSQSLSGVFPGSYRHPAEAIIYEAHVRDLGGTYLGCIPKLKEIADIGITHLQLLPVQLFGRTDETLRAFEDPDDPETANYNWGYDPIHYFVPSGWYASDPADPYCRLRELRSLVDAAHKHGLRLTVDVVYNHAASVDSWEHSAPNYWFRMRDDGNYASNSGCGNDFETTRSMWRRLFVESLCWLVEFFDVDGFRFDLMGLIDTDSIKMAYSLCSAIKADVLFIGEGWKMYNGPKGTKGMDQYAVEKESPVAVFNDEIRDLLKGGGLNESTKAFLHGHAVDLDKLFRNIAGLAGVNYKPAQAWNSVNYIEAHDGLTAYDNIVVNCRLDSARDHREAVRRLAIGNAILSLSSGMLFLHAGQERGRSKALPTRLRHGPAEQIFETVGGFVRNSYRAGDAVNRLSSFDDKEREWLREYTHGMIAFRKTHLELFSRTRQETESAIKNGALKYLKGKTGGMAILQDSGSDFWIFAFNPTKHAVEFAAGDFVSKDFGGKSGLHRETSATGLVPGKEQLSVFVDGKSASPLVISKVSGITLSHGKLRLEALSCAVFSLPRDRYTA